MEGSLSLADKDHQESDNDGSLATATIPRTINDFLQMAARQQIQKSKEASVQCDLIHMGADGRSEKLISILKSKQLKVKSIPWKVPRIDSQYFSIADVQHVVAQAAKLLPYPFRHQGRTMLFKSKYRKDWISKSDFHLARCSVH